MGYLSWSEMGRRFYEGADREFFVMSGPSRLPGEIRCPDCGVLVERWPPRCCVVPVSLACGLRSVSDGGVDGG
jgi:hypothetical protein